MIRLGIILITILITRFLLIRLETKIFKWFINSRIIIMTDDGDDDNLLPKRVNGLSRHCETIYPNSDCPYIDLGCNDCKINLEKAAQVLSSDLFLNIKIADSKAIISRILK